MYLDVRDLRQAARGIGQEPGDARGPAAAHVRGMNPGADFEAVGGDPTVQATAANDLLTEEYAEDDVPALGPVKPPRLDPRPAAAVCPRRRSSPSRPAIRSGSRLALGLTAGTLAAGAQAC